VIRSARKLFEFVWGAPADVRQQAINEALNQVKMATELSAPWNVTSIGKWLLVKVGSVPLSQNFACLRFHSLASFPFLSFPLHSTQSC